MRSYDALVDRVLARINLHIGIPSTSKYLDSYLIALHKTVFMNGVARSRPCAPSHRVFVLVMMFHVHV